jgi:dinuclear metal center YbgI/SA1388 family protein
MSVTDCRIETIADYLNGYLRVAEIPDYPNALNGLQLNHQGPVRRLAAAVDTSLRTIDGAIAVGANALLVHHGMFWSGLQRFEGHLYERIHRLISNDIAIYSAHLPLDAHDVHGNSRLLAKALGLAVAGGFAAFRGVHCGVSGDSNLPTTTIRERLSAFSLGHGGAVVTTPFVETRTTRRWAICSGSGANADTLAEAANMGIDTLIVGEGPHWTAVDANDSGLVIMYGGHYATETTGVQSLAAHIADRFGIEWTFVAAPTGL